MSMADYLVRYVESRGIPMPYYTNGSKIIEEAEELREAIEIGMKDAIMDEAADVTITALVAARQWGFTIEEALERKIAKDTGRGPKRGEERALAEEELGQEMDLPGAWSYSDFTGGIEEVRGPDWKREPQYLDNPKAVGAPPNWRHGYLSCGCRHDGFGGHVR